MFSSNPISIPFGIIIGLLASCVQSLGLTIQRKSHVLNQSLPEHRQRDEHRRPLWLLGFVIFISSNVLGSLVQIASLPVVILAPLGAVSLLWNAFFARLLLGDVFSPWMVLGTILIAGGAILIAFFGIVPEQTRSLEDLLELFRRPTFIAYFSALGFVVLVCLMITHIVEFSLSRRMAKSSSSSLSPSSLSVDLPDYTTDLATGITDTINHSTIATERTPLLDRKSGSSTPLSISAINDIIPDPKLTSINRKRLLLAVSYASFSGIISGMCLIFAKSGVELLVLTLGGKNQFWRWEAWVLVAGLAVFALLQLWYLHKALILADPTLVCPSAFCFYNLSSIVNGLVYFNQISLISRLHLGLVILGIAILLGGVWVVSIQSGGGGVDVGAWNEEHLDFPDENAVLCPEPDDENEEDARIGETVPLTQQPQAQPISRLGPVAMDRETRSESSLPNIPTSPTGLGPDLGPEGLVHRHNQDSMLRSGKRRRAETQLYPTHRSPSHRSRKRPAADARVSSSSTAHQGHSRTASHHHAPLSPPLGTGFQIGLSPVSPGFTIMPLERRRPSGIGIGGPSMTDVANEVVGDGVRARRRTVSEGEVGRMSGVARESSDVESGHGEAEQSEESAAARTLHDEVGSRPERRDRWRWLRNVFADKRR
ncbi:unnamed protein product [Cyclocybe aegerita]|uniref:Magnesium transporter n=1 Tax=Cyclocybe aegerita TaxID=1973307 RepID=A0A8S0W0W7_CYCAE|nr:unnamed protein product [Cyclocybe aegerita]